MKINKEWIVLAVIIILLILYLALRQQDNIQYQFPEIEKISQIDISKIEISKPDDTIIIEKKGEKWVIGQQEYLADSNRVENMLDLLEEPVLTAMVSDSKSYTRYGLDDKNKITVRIFSNDNIRREIELGNLTDSGRHTFIKLDNDYRVYHARNNLRDQFNRGIDELRDKTALSFDQNEIREIGIIKGSQSVNIVLKEDLASDTSNDQDPETETSPSQEIKKVWQTSKGEKVANSLPDYLLSNLSGLSCKGYLNDTNKEDWTSPIFTITLKGPKEYTLLIFSKKDDAEDTYPAVSSENDYPFMLIDWLVEELFETTDEILGNPKDS